LLHLPKGNILIDSISDIEALAGKCRSEQSKIYVSEAIKCYRGGAYRAAIVSTWVAVVFDLIDKVRELSLAGDGEAKKIEEKYENYMQQIAKNDPKAIKQATDFERNILETCKDKLEFFDAQQMIDMKRLKEDRNRCAHPSFQTVGVPYSPSAEQARLHIRNAVVHVLSEPPIQGKAALAKLKETVSSNYFPKEREKILVQFKSLNIDKSTDALVRGFVDELVFGFMTKDDPYFYNINTINALNAMFELYPAIVEGRLEKQINTIFRNLEDKYFVGAAWLVSQTNQAWVVLEEASREKIISFVKDGPVNEFLPGIVSLYEINDLKVHVENRIDGLNLENLKEAVKDNGIDSLAKNRSLDLLEKSKSFIRVNDIFSNIIFKIFESLSKEDIERVIRMPVEHSTDLIGANEYGSFIELVKNSKKFDIAELEGLLKANKASYLVDDGIEN
jgi:polyhydroxyalkanoate synthesis regulator phasin/uncharacterized protein YjgD (DUF1641 family)